MNNAVSLSALILRFQDTLAQAGVDNPALDARLLVAHALGCERVDLVLQSERVLTEDDVTRVEALIARRVKREPVARILGMREFWGLPFGLNEATLEPRPDSETLVETMLALWSGARGQQSKVPLPLREGGRDSAQSKLCAQRLRILDLGTGTGCLLLALLHEWPEATGLGVDVAIRAVEQAMENAERLGLAGRAEFRVGDWLEGIDETFDIVVSNPPYIVSGDIPALMPDVREHDPLAALDGGTDGLDVYRHLIPRLPKFLNPNGFAVFEVGQGQAGAVRALFREAGFADITVHKDLGGIERCVAGTKNDPSPCKI
jgi:release factor glutamine methyltransferase